MTLLISQPKSPVRRAATIFLAVATALLPSASLAADAYGTRYAPIMTLSTRPAARPASASVRTIDLAVGRSEMIDLDTDASDIFVANPKIANALIKSNRRLFLVGASNGSTSIYIMDADGRRIATFEVRVAQDLSLLRETLAQTIPGAQIVVSMVGNKIILTGEVASAGEAQQAVDIASAFLEGGPSGAMASTMGPGGMPVLPSDDSGSSTGGANGSIINALTIRGQDQVMLKVQVAEISRNVLKQLGVNANGTWKVGNWLAGGVFDAPFSLAGMDKTRTILGGDFSGDRGKGSAFLKAMEQAGVARTLAEPTLTAVSGESATFLVGGEMPVPTAVQCQPNGGSCNPTVTFKKFGVSLNFTPVVMSAGRMSIRVGTEVSEIDSTIAQTIPISDDTSFTIPGFKTRKFESTVELPSGATMMTAGLIQTNTRQAINGFPGLMNLPILGALFRSRDYQRQETELVITVTPYLSKPVDPKKAVRPDKGFESAPDPATVFLGQINRVTPRQAPTKQPLNGVGFIVN